MRISDDFWITQKNALVLANLTKMFARITRYFEHGSRSWFWMCHDLNFIAALHIFPNCPRWWKIIINFSFQEKFILFYFFLGTLKKLSVDEKFDSDTRIIGFCLEIYSEVCVSKYDQIYQKSHFNNLNKV